MSRAHDRELGRDVAIKELISRGDVHEVRFLREALITARLEHPGIVPVHEAGRWPDGTPFYAMKLVSGRPLRDLIAERTTVETRIALLHHVIAVAEAIAYAHGRNIIHRDLKPANVIVGDFGETVVIDWGLAKDLTGAKASVSTSGPFRIRRDDDLTAEGSILGTPAYMAPEQERGEQVDQRADVFAIGAMLWELCALQRVPPTEARHRHRILRRAGIDRDLVTIIDKALDPDPDRRYLHAGALAADLKAFKSGARIAARTYSVFATLAHWTRRHRVVAISVIAALAVAAAAAVLYVRNVATARDRADAAAIRAESAKNAVLDANRATEVAYHQLSLKNAALLLASDPSAAWDALNGYRGPDQELASLLRAKAQGLGVAKVRVSAHKDNVYRTEPLSDGSLLSISEDGTIATTTIDGASHRIAANATSDNVSSFSRTRELLAYACQPEGLCIVDPIHQATQTVPGVGVPGTVAFSPDGQQLAVRYGDHLVVFRLAGAPAATVRIDVPTARGVVFVSDTRLLVVAKHGVQLVELDTGRAGPVIAMAASAFASDGDRVVLGNDRGEILQLRARDWPGPATPLAVCSGRINAVIALATKHLYAYACQDGEVGVRATGDNRLVGHYHQDSSVLSLTSSADEQYIVTGGPGGAMRIYDLQSDNLSYYNGQIGRLITVSGPAAAFPYFASGDDDGYIRIWGRPQATARTILRARAPICDVQVLDDGTVIGIGEEPVLRWWRTTGTGQVSAHETGASVLRRSPDPAYFATYGHDGMILLWDATRLEVIRRIAAGPLADLRFLSDGVSLASSGEDGRLLVWSPDRREPRLVAQAPHPLGSLQVLRRDDRAIVAERGGAVSVIDTRSPGQRVALRAGHGETISQLVVSDDGQWLGMGTSAGEVTLYSTTTWEPVPVMSARGAIRAIALSPDLTMISVISEDGLTHLVAFPGRAAPSKPERWDTIAVPARGVKFSPDGSLLVITTSDGGVYFYSVARRTWRYMAFPATNIFGGRFSSDGRRYATADSNAQVKLFDLSQLSD